MRSRSMPMWYPQPYQGGDSELTSLNHTENNHSSPATTAKLLTLTMQYDIMPIDHYNPQHSNLARITLVHNESISTQWSQVFNYQGAGRGCRSSCWLMGCCPHHELLGSMTRPRNVTNKHHWPQRKAFKQQHSSHNCQTKKINAHNDSGDPTPQSSLQVGSKVYNNSNNNKILVEFEKGWIFELTYIGDWKRLNCRGDDRSSDEKTWILAMPTGQVAKLSGSVGCDYAWLDICWDAWALMRNCMHPTRKCVVGPHAQSIPTSCQVAPPTPSFGTWVSHPLPH